MKTQQRNESNKEWKKILLPLGLVVAILSVGVGGMLIMNAMRTPPQEEPIIKETLKVTTRQVAFEDITETITGFGTVQCPNRVKISPLVSGRVAQVHDNLQEGGKITKGEVLFRLETKDFVYRQESILTRIKEKKEAVIQVEKQYAYEKKQLKYAQQNLELAQKNHQRITSLLKEHQIGTRSQMEKAERELIANQKEVDRIEHEISLYPSRIRQAEQALGLLDVELATVRLNIERCEIKAPFSGCVRQIGIKPYQFTAQGTPVLELVDDANKEIHISIRGDKASGWFLSDQFKTHQKNYPCTIRWVEAEDGNTISGVVDRIIEYNDRTRTILVAVRICPPKQDISNLASAGSADQLLEGMFCKVTISGNVLHNVVRIPQEAIHLNSYVFIVEENRLKKKPVQVAYAENDIGWITKGPNPGDRLVMDRVSLALEGSVVEEN
jgi:multidrug resistance efflux pump